MRRRPRRGSACPSQPPLLPLPQRPQLCPLSALSTPSRQNPSHSCRQRPVSSCEFWEELGRTLWSSDWGDPEAGGRWEGLGARPGVGSCPRCPCCSGTQFLPFPTSTTTGQSSAFWKHPSGSPATPRGQAATARPAPDGGHGPLKTRPQAPGGSLGNRPVGFPLCPWRSLAFERPGCWAPSPAVLGAALPTARLLGACALPAGVQGYDRL